MILVPQTEQSHIDIELWTHHVQAATCPHFAEEDSESSRLTAGARLYSSLSCSPESVAHDLDGSPPFSRVSSVWFCHPAPESTLLLQATTMGYTQNEEEESTETRASDNSADFEGEPFNVSGVPRLCATKF
jgi:hypothetical protein